ncbi:TolB-like 6-bladed beta-propeller domain-containing protein [Parabacteroides sp. OttesenSCG-928-G06]|nr:TolB-like 6-bladed beta-propeller domain-containing protein [Parabacteroides sp. OttesenSCG-928-G06]
MWIKNTYIKKSIGLSFLLFFSCTSGHQKDEVIKFEKEYMLKHKDYETELLITYGRLTVIDTFLVLVSNQRESLCKVYSIPEGMKEVASYGRFGNGPKEFLQPLLTYSYNNTFGLNELNKQELAIMELVEENGEVCITEQKRLKAPYQRKKGELNPSDYYFSKLDDSHYVSLLCAGKNRFFSLLDSSLTPIKQFGESPIAEELPVIASRRRLRGSMTAENGTMVFAAADIPYLACYKLETNEMVKQWSFFYDQTFYEVRNDDLLLSKEKSYGYLLDLQMDSRFIYILYLDQLLSEYDSKLTEKSCANKVLVFDYKGNAVAKLHLDCRINGMAISKDRTKLFGLAQLPDPVFVVFDLPKELNK